MTNEEARSRAAQLAREWWANQTMASAICDRCNADVPRGKGYINPAGLYGSADLLCSDCFDPSDFPREQKPSGASDGRTSTEDIVMSIAVLVVIGACVAYWYLG